MNKYREHALSCGIDLTGQDADSIDAARVIGAEVSYPINSIENMETLVKPGTVLTPPMIQWLKSFGIDYVIFWE